jgi:RNA polymerase sigma factor (sigma-70 family)
MTDVELLNQHRNGSEAAFADLVRRHLAWVYGLARRRLGDAHLAEDVAQAVFVLLHRKSPRFAADRAMMSWLYKTASYASDSAARGERRRQHRESKVAMSRPEATAPQEPAEWQQLAPLLDELIGRLPRADREAILLRYYRDLSFAEIAEQIGVTPDAARKRVERAVEKLRQLAAERGGAISAAGLAAGLAAFVRIPPPAGLVATATVTATAPAGSAMAASTAAIVKGAVTMMASTKLTIFAVVTVACVVLGGAICGTVWMLADGQPDSNNAQTPTTAPATLPAQATASHPVQFDAGGPLPKLAPYSAIRWHGQIPEVQIEDTWYGLIAINGLTVNKIMASQKDNEPHRKHFAEDLVELMTRMGQAPAATVTLQVQTLDAERKLLTLQNVPMTEENRQALMNWPAPGQTSLFQGYRLKGPVPQIQEGNTWYELRAIERVPIGKIIGAGKTAYGPDWQNYNDTDRLTEILTGMGRKPQNETLLELQTLDTDETVELTIRVPGKN